MAHLTVLSHLKVTAEEEYMERVVKGRLSSLWPLLWIQSEQQLA